MDAFALPPLDDDDDAGLAAYEQISDDGEPPSRSAEDSSSSDEDGAFAAAASRKRKRVTFQDEDDSDDDEDNDDNESPSRRQPHIQTSAVVVATSANPAKRRRRRAGEPLTEAGYIRMLRSGDFPFLNIPVIAYTPKLFLTAIEVGQPSALAELKRAMIDLDFVVDIIQALHSVQETASCEEMNVAWERLDYYMRGDAFVVEVAKRVELNVIPKKFWTRSVFLGVASALKLTDKDGATHIFDALPEDCASDEKILNFLLACNPELILRVNAATTPDYGRLVAIAVRGDPRALVFLPQDLQTAEHQPLFALAAEQIYTTAYSGQGNLRRLVRNIRPDLMTAEIATALCGVESHLVALLLPAFQTDALVDAGMSEEVLASLPAERQTLARCLVVTRQFLKTRLAYPDMKTTAPIIPLDHLVCSAELLGILSDADPTVFKRIAQSPAHAARITLKTIAAVVHPTSTSCKLAQIFGEAAKWHEYVSAAELSRIYTWAARTIPFWPTWLPPALASSADDMTPLIRVFPRAIFAAQVGGPHQGILDALRHGVTANFDHSACTDARCYFNDGAPEEAPDVVNFVSDLCRHTRAPPTA